MKKNKFFGYWVVFYAFVLMFFIFTIIKSLHSLFLVPVTEDLGMERSAFSFIFTITGVSVAFALPIITKLLKYVSIRLLMTISILMTSIGFASFSFAREPWQFYIIAVIVGAGTAGCTNMIISLLINNWFISRRGLAMGIAFTGSGFGAVCITPVLTKTLELYGWQTSYIMCGLAMAVACIPLTFFCAYRYPSEKGQKPFQEASDTAVTEKATANSGMYLKDLKKYPLFWLFLLIVLLSSATLGGVHLHIPAYLTDIGHTSSFVAIVIMAQSICIIFGKIILGMIFDTFGTIKGTAFLEITLSFAFICLILAKNPIIAFVFALFYGCGCTLTTVGFPFLTGSIFGQRNYTAILSLVNMVYVVGAATGPFLSGLIYDMTGQYQMTWVAYLIIFAVSMTILVLVEKKFEKMI